MRPLSVLVALAASVVAAALAAPSALAHAELLGSKPRPGQTLERSPRVVVLTFDEGIEPEFVQLRVEDRVGKRVDRGAPYHPSGREELLAVRLTPRLQGRYVASYRVISEDGHPVTKETAFRVRPAEQNERAEREEVEPSAPSAEMPPPSGEAASGHEQTAGDATDAAFAFARGLGYLSMALAIGAVAFVLAAWLPALADQAGAAPNWRSASMSFIERLRLVAVGAVVLGLVATLAAIVLEGATAVGVSFWQALDRDVIEAVTGTRVVQAWSARLVLWLLLGALLLLALRPRRAPVLRRAALGAEGAVLAPTPPRPQVLMLCGAVVALALTAPLAGHAASYSPSALLVAVNTLHVLCMGAWLGGLVLLVYALFGAARELGPHDRTALMAGVTARFSRLATLAVAVLLLTGIGQSVAFVGSVDALFETTYGRLVLAKVTLFLALIGLGAYNQRRSLPRLRGLAASGVEPGRAGALLRRAVAIEIAIALGVLGVTSALVATQPVS